MRVFLAFCAFLGGLLAAVSAQAQSPFTASGATVNLAVTATTGRVAVPTDAYNTSIRIYNNSATIAAFINCGDATVTATTTAGMPVAPGTVEAVGCGKGYIAAITASGTTTLYMTPGAGL